jgi:hypothetical protein
MVCSFISSHQTQSFTLLVLSPSANRFWASNPTFFFGNSSFGFAPALLYQKKPELGGAVISIRAESQYLEFSMAALV